jgi:hypothetical protein
VLLASERKLLESDDRSRRVGHDGERAIPVLGLRRQQDATPQALDARRERRGVGDEDVG